MLDEALLSLPPLHHEAATPVSSTTHYESLPNDFVDSLKKVLLAYFEESNSSIEVAAALCDMSKRSLQRRLLAASTHYSAVRDQVRFDAAKRLLQDPGNSVTDVALRLGYSDVTHFSRAFRRIAGVTPRIYRQQYQH